MIRLHTLGSIELRGWDGVPLSAILQRPKRLALLCYLALARPRGFQRRDTLLGLFWPELDQDHARGALSQALFILRRSLGDGVIRSRGMEEVGVDATMLWCDAVAFATALEEERPADALELYRGPLLDGVYLSAAGGFERWLEEERARLQALATAAAGALSLHEEASGDSAQALRWVRRATAMAPMDEQASRRLIGLLDRAGDRASALHEYDRFELKLRQTYESEPSAESQALIAAVRGRMEPWVAPAAQRPAPNRIGPTSAPPRRRWRAAPEAGGPARTRMVPSSAREGGESGLLRGRILNLLLGLRGGR